VRDVAWCPNIGSPYDVIVSCSEDFTANFWANQGRGTDFQLVQTVKCSGPVWKASWNISGSLVAISCVSDNSDNCVKVFRVHTLYFQVIFLGG